MTHDLNDFYDYITRTCSDTYAKRNCRIISILNDAGITHEMLMDYDRDEFDDKICELMGTLSLKTLRTYRGAVLNYRRFCGKSGVWED